MFIPVEFTTALLALLYSSDHSMPKGQFPRWKPPREAIDGRIVFVLFSDVSHRIVPVIVSMLARHYGMLVCRSITLARPDGLK